MFIPAKAAARTARQKVYGNTTKQHRLDTQPVDYEGMTEMGGARPGGSRSKLEDVGQETAATGSSTSPRTNTIAEEAKSGDSSWPFTKAQTGQ